MLTAAAFLYATPMDFTTRKKMTEELMKKMHAGQVRAGDVPVWHHLARVSRVLEKTLEETGEGSAEEREAIVLAAYGHDSLEDTPITKEDIAGTCGARALSLVEGMTNTFGDDHPEPYANQVAAADEGVRLIKLSDLYDNLTGATYNLFALGVKWNHSYFLPIVTPMIAAVMKTEFTAFPRTAERLKGMVRTAHDRLLEEIRRFEEAGREK